MTMTDDTLSRGLYPRQRTEAEEWNRPLPPVTWSGWGSPVGAGIFLVGLGVAALLIRFAIRTRSIAKRIRSAATPKPTRKMPAPTGEPQPDQVTRRFGVFPFLRFGPLPCLLVAAEGIVCHCHYLGLLLS